MTNLHLTVPPTEVVRARLKVLLDSINATYKNGTSVFEEDLAAAYNDAILIFLKSLDSSIVSVMTNIKKGMPADPLNYNMFTNALARDLEALFLEISALDKIIVSSFNSIVSEREQVLQVSKRISNKLGDYLLYADPRLGGGWFFGDSFNTTERIETGSSLLEGDECFISTEEGVILLPLNGQPIIPKIKSYIINKPSNGTAGNNYQLDVVGKDELAAIGDNQPNTWYEYEKVTAYESNEPLIFDITIALQEISVINHIHINPINFGTPTPVQIDILETSKDGIEYISIKDEIPLKDFVSEDEEDVFQLSASTNKFAGQGFYSFLPRKAQYIHIVFKQTTPYAIQTSNGTRLRYAIGIRDINILGRKFKTEGSIISTPFSIEKDIRKVALWASENPIEASTLADVTHSISENDGATWHPIQPQDRSSFDIPEILNFNNIATNSITTSSAVNTLRHKVTMKRDTEAFDGDVTIKQEKVTQNDIVNVPLGGNFDLTTTQPPIAETVRVILPFYGSYSSPTARYGDTVRGKSAVMDLDFLEFNIDVPAVDTLRFPLPYKNIKNLQEHIRVLVNGEQWEFAPQDEDRLGLNGDHSATSYEEVTADSKVYFLNKGGRELQFGYIHHTPAVEPSEESFERIGYLPPAGAKIQVCLDGDNPRLELTDAGYVLNLSSDSDGFKENVSIVSIDSLTEEEAADHTIELSSGRSEFKVYPPIKTKFTGIAKDGTKLSYAEPIGRVFSSSSKVIGVDKATDEGIQKSLNYGAYFEVAETEGAIPPIFLDDSDTWDIEEYDLDGDLITGANKQYAHKKTTFIDGRTELTYHYGDIWVIDPEGYSFDAYTGTVYLGSTPETDRKVIFKCKMLEHTVVPMESWEFYRSQIHKRIDSSKIILDPKYVNTFKRSISVDGTSTPVTSASLVTEDTKSHDWFKQRLVKGTVALGPELFDKNTRPTEVPFIDGDLELHSIVQVQNETISATLSANIYSFDLQKINSSHILSGSPSFAPVRSVSNPSTPESQFTTLVSGTPSANGEWSFTTNLDDTVTVSVYQDGGTLNSHTVSYKYIVDDPGVDTSGLYSIDYNTGTIHFAEQITSSGVIEFEVSLYSAFYNISEVVSDNDINNIDEEGKTITLSSSIGMRFLKLTSALKARPPYVKVSYEYYKRSTESLKDLEPYFSPICKDIALRAVTADILEEL